jgi:hypothetical protein
LQQNIELTDCALPPKYFPILLIASSHRQSGIGVGKYIELYEQQWKGLMKSQDRAGTLLRDYPERSVWTTWMIWYHAIWVKSMATANLLLLMS